MLYNVDKKNGMLDALNSRVSNIVDICIALLEEGYLPNNAKFTKLSWSAIMIDGFNNIDVLSKEQHSKLETLYNKVMSL